MTLPQLVGPIDVVSPEHSSGEWRDEFQITSSKNASIEFFKAEYARPTIFFSVQRLMASARSFNMFQSMLHLGLID